MQSGSSGPLAPGSTAGSAVVENGGITVQVLFVGRHPSGKQITVSTSVANNNEEPVNVALIGPEPTAIDNRGIRYALSSISGIPVCDNLANNRIANCLKQPNFLANEAFARLDPGAQTVAALTFQSDEVSNSGAMSIALSLAVVPGDGVTKETRESVRNVPITFPMIDLAAAR